MEGSESEGTYVFDGHVQIVETLGEDVLVYVRLQEGVELRASFDRGEWNEGDKDIRISVRADKVYFFDKEGSRL